MPAPSPYLWLVLSTLCIAGGSVLAKRLLLMPASPSPLSFIALQLAGSVVLLGVAASMSRTARPTIGALRALIPAGAVLGLGAIATILALANTTASEATVVFALQPALIVLLAWLVLAERPSPATLGAGLIALAGVLLIVTDSGVGNGPDRVIGALYAFAPTWLFALYVVWMRRAVVSTSPIVATLTVQAIALGVASSSLLVPGIVPGTAPDPAMSIVTVSGIAGVGALHYGAGYLLYVVALRSVPAGPAGMFLNLVPVFTIALAVPVLGERLSTVQWIGAGITLLAVTALAGRRSRNTSSED